MTKWQVTKQQVTKQQVTKQQVTKQQVTKWQVTKWQVTKWQVTKQQVTKQQTQITGHGMGNWFFSRPGAVSRPCVCDLAPAPYLRRELRRVGAAGHPGGRGLLGGRGPAVNISVVMPSALGPSELARWRELQEASIRLDNPFLSGAFAVQVGSVLPAARVAVFEDGNEIVAFFPFSCGPFRTGRPLAPGIADCEGLVHAPGFEFDASRLLRAARLETLEFDHLLGDQLPETARQVHRAESPVVDVSESFETYLCQRRKAAKGVISSLERKRRKLERESASVHFEDDDRRPEVLHQLMEWKSAQYRRTGRSDRFARPWVRSLVEGLFDSDEPGCTGRVVSLESEGHVIAALFGVTSSTVFSSWFPGYDRDHGRHSPGLLLFLAAAERAAAGEPPGAPAELRGRRGGPLPLRFDLGKGDEEYKSVLANDAVEVTAARLDLGTPLALARRLQRYPQRVAVDVVVSHPWLRRRARGVLRGVGRARRLLRS